MKMSAKPAAMVKLSDIMKSKKKKGTNKGTKKEMKYGGC